MNEVVKVSISGLGFVFDTEAYGELKVYLDKLEEIYSNSPDGEEIIADIEARIVELILTRQSAEQVVSQPLVHEIIEQMGMPEEQEIRSPSQQAETDAESTFPRRLYRNPDGAKLGGVCNGLGTFFGVDPVWVRLGIFLPLFLLILFPVIGIYALEGFLGAFFGVLVMLYFIMWFAVPVARTPRQKLEMNGQRITASSIHKNAARESDMPPASRRSESVFAELFTMFGKVLMVFIKAVILLIGLSIAVGAVAILIGLFSIPFVERVGDGYMVDMLDGMAGIGSRGYIALILAAMLLPMAMIGYLLLQLVFNGRVNRTIMWIMSGTWLIVLVYTGAVSVRNKEVLRDIYYETRTDYDGGWEDRWERFEDRWEDWEDRFDEGWNDRNDKRYKKRRDRTQCLESGRSITTEDVDNLIIDGDTVIKDGQLVGIEALHEKYGEGKPENIGTGAAKSPVGTDTGNN